MYFSGQSATGLDVVAHRERLRSYVDGHKKRFDGDDHPRYPF